MQIVHPSWRETHDRFTVHGLVDTSAPVQASDLLEILATPARVWQILTDVAAWPHIRSDIHDVKTDGIAQPGRSFT